MACGTVPAACEAEPIGEFAFPLPLMVIMELLGMRPHRHWLARRPGQ
jgi:hypothetical protein